jgi:hypothetical protein
MPKGPAHPQRACDHNRERGRDQQPGSGHGVATADRGGDDCLRSEGQRQRHEYNRRVWSGTESVPQALMPLLDQVPAQLPSEVWHKAVANTQVMLVQLARSGALSPEQPEYDGWPRLSLHSDSPSHMLGCPVPAAPGTRGDEWKSGATRHEFPAANGFAATRSRGWPRT